MELSLRGRGGLVAAIAFAVLLLVGGLAVRAFSSGTPSDVAAAQDSGCTTINVAVSSEKARITAELAEEYNAEGRTVADTCVFVNAYSAASGRVADQLVAGWDSGDLEATEAQDGSGTVQRPDVWSPVDSSWTGVVNLRLREADRQAVIPTESESVVTSPLVVAMPQPLAEALGWPQQQIGWADLLALANDPQGWASVGHPEWGSFKMGKTNPHVSTFGFQATLATYYAATGLVSDLTVADLNKPEVRAFVSGVESATVHYGPLSSAFLTNMAHADEQGRGTSYVSAVPLEEKNVFDYNSGDPDGNPDTGETRVPKTPLAAVYPSDGTAMFDHPYLVLDAAWVDDAKRALADDFLSYLHGGPQQSRYQQAGFRSYDGQPGAEMTQQLGMLPAQPTRVITTPAPAVLDEVLNSWDELRKRGRVLLLLDVSGSMGAEAEGTGLTKLEAAKKAALASLDGLAQDDEVGLWVFSNGHREAVPVAALASNRAKLKRAIAALEPGGGTDLYTSAQAAVAELRANPDTSRITAVVLLSDGQNDGGGDLSGLLSDLDVEDEAAVVRVFPIGYGEDADMPTLTKIAEASRAAAYDATNAASIDRVLEQVLSNF